MSDELLEVEQEEETPALVIPEDVDVLKKMLADKDAEVRKTAKALRAERKTSKDAETGLRVAELTALKAQKPWLTDEDLAEIPRSKWSAEVERIEALHQRIAAQAAPGTTEAAQETAEEQARLKAARAMVNGAGGQQATTGAGEKMARAAADRKLKTGDWTMAEYKQAVESGQVELSGGDWLKR